MASKSIRHAMDPDHGVISREIFVDSDVYQDELKKLFTRVWLFVGHESLIQNPGDFYASRMAEESVILCRDERGSIHVFLNSCRHRGMKVCRYDQGNTSLSRARTIAGATRQMASFKVCRSIERYMKGTSIEPNGR
jgi:hypothetical protein